jgi:hypothetical protein
MSTVEPPFYGNASQAVPPRGGTEAAIQHHYDVSNAFYALWLDETLTYSCGLWHEGDDPDDLLAAQRRKVDWRPARRNSHDGVCSRGCAARRATAATTAEALDALDDRILAHGGHDRALS